jgi:hypothetical protein
MADQGNLIRHLFCGTQGNRDGITAVEVYRPSNNTFYLSNNNSTVSAAIVPPFIAPNDLPVVGNWAGF